MRFVICFGGNAIGTSKDTPAKQIEKIESTIFQLKDILEKEEVVLIHGNGSQVGNLLLQQESCTEVPKLSLDTLDAMTQGQIGYWLLQSIENIVKRKCCIILTRVLVDMNSNISLKPVGPFYHEKILENMVYVPKRGYRRVVPSPKPVKILEIDIIKNFLKKGFLVIAGGGGGIPVIENGNKLIGVEAVVDKDYTSELIASEIKADILLFLTDVDGVEINYGKENQTKLDLINVEEAEKYLLDNQFGEGRMKPKIEACISFLRKGGKKCIITLPEKVKEALNGKSGTTIIP
ncbi:MAG: carbamate kinase [Candidatus Aenigmatarchaeota archaeon]